MYNPQEAIALLEKTAELCDQEGAPVCRGAALRSVKELIKQLNDEIKDRNKSLIKIRDTLVERGKLNASLIDEKDEKNNLTNFIYSIVESCFEDAAEIVNEEITERKCEANA